jgi:GNAT superfamily N-acetyltransferase
MGDAWMPLVQLPLTIEEFRRLPRNAAYKYEYLSGKAYLSPRPRHYHAMLDLVPMPRSADLDIGSLDSDDWTKLVPLFAGSFRHIQPYGSIAEDATRTEAAREALERTRTGGDGPWIDRASFVVRQDQRAVGVILITLLPDADPCDWDSYHWPEPPPADCIAHRQGRPHLTWIFVSPRIMGRGIGTALLGASVNALLELGFTQLLSTFMVGNDSSVLWHWRNGFRLLSYPGSKRHRLLS